MSKIVIGQQFCGPPNSGNGGYVCGVLAGDTEGPANAVIRARVPLDVDLSLESVDGVLTMTDAEGGLIGTGGPADGALLPTPPTPPSLAAAQAASTRYFGLENRVHPICFTCGPERKEGDGLRVFVGQIEGEAPGMVAGPWTPHPAFADADGLTPTAVIWGAMDCPGFFAWVTKEGRHGALLGTMTAEVLRRPRAGETCIITAWPLVREGRKETAGVALFSAEGELLARAYQIWISMGPLTSQPVAQSATA